MSSHLDSTSEHDLIKKVLAYLIAATITLCLGDPLFSFWPSTLTTFLFFLLGQHEIAVNSSKRYLQSFFYTFFFFILIKLFVLRGFFLGYYALVNNLGLSLLSFSAFTIVESFVPALIGILLQFSLNHRARWFGALMLLVVLCCIHETWYIWIPQGIEFPLAQSTLLLSAYGALTHYGFLFWYLGLTLALYYHLRSPSKRILSKSRCCMTIIFLLSPFIIGFLRREHFRHIPHTTHPVILVQTNQSELKSHPTPVDWEKINDVFKKIDLSNTPLIVFPEYTSTASNPKFQDFIKDLGRRGKFDLVIGVKDTAGGELINEAWHLNQNGKVSSSGKLLGFPIGEAKLNLPFIPKSWLRAQIPIAQSHAIENFKTPALKLKTLICYDATFSKNYRSSKESALSVIVNISKDSHLQNTSAIDWLDLVVRAKMSLSGKSGIRVSSNSYTEIVTPWGESLQVSNKNQFQVIQTQFVVYP